MKCDISTLNEDQSVVAQHILAGGSCAIIAEAGSGKGYTLETVLPFMEGVAICAFTGAGALNIGMGATTIHRLFGFKPEIQTPIKRNNKVPKVVEDVLRNIKVLVIDEVGQVRRDLLEAMDYRLRKVNNNDLPWGGVQVIMAGDFQQLKPIKVGSEAKFYDKFYPSTWAFTSDSFKCVPVFTLSKIERNADARQQRILRSIRNKDNNSGRALSKLVADAEPYNPDDKKIVLCQFNVDVDKINELEYKLNRNKAIAYKSISTGTPKDLKEIPVPDTINLKVGLKVMLVVNDSDGQYVNGDQGEVLQCEKDCVMVKLNRTGGTVIVPPYKFTTTNYAVRGEGLTQKIVATRLQLPIKLAYALSIFKSQGCTLQSACIHLGNKGFSMDNTFYVGISRVTDLRKLSFIRTPTEADIKTDREAQEYMRSLKV